MSQGKYRYTHFSIRHLRIEHPEGYEPAGMFLDTMFNKWIFVYCINGHALFYTAAARDASQITFEQLEPLSSSEIIMFLASMGVSNTEWLRKHMVD